MRGTRAHATVTVDGYDQSAQGGSFLWARHARCRLLADDVGVGWAIGEHDGYALGLAVSHRRAVIALTGSGFLVVDRLECAVSRTYEQTWPLGPGLQPVVNGTVVTARATEGHALVLHVEATDPVSVVASRDGVYSRRLEKWEPAWVARARVAVAGVVEIATLVLPACLEAADVATSVAVEQAAGSTNVRVAVAGRDETFRLDLGAASPVVHR
jgi:hypothetical protein